MDVSNGSLKKKKKKKAKTSKRGRDFFSDLPDPIIAHILSFLPLKDAIQTVLLRRFGEVWRGIRVLDLNSCFYHNCEEPDHGPDYINENFVNVIRGVLNLHDNSTLDKLSLKFCFRLTYTREQPDELDNVEWEARTSAEIEKLIRYAISRKVKVLDLNLKGCESVEPWEFYNLPDVLRSDHLTYLKLAAFDMTSCKVIDLKSLRILVLNDISLNDAIMKAFSLHCPVLENLSLVHCYGFGVLICRNPKLKKLLLALDKECSPVLVSCPHVLSLDIYGYVEHIWLVDASSAVDVSICIGRRYMRLNLKEAYGHLFFHLNSFSKCKSLSLCTWSVMMICEWNMIHLAYSSPSFKWTNLTLKLRLTKWHLSGLSALFNYSPSLETLSMYIYPVYHGDYDELEEIVPEWVPAWAGEENFWDSREAALPCLETIMICGYVDEPYVIQMVEFLLKSATALQKLVISTNQSLKKTCECWYVWREAKSPQYTAVQLQELSRKLGSMPRASHEAAIHFC